MVFSSAVFIFLFLPVVLYLYMIMPQKFRNTLLLIASLIFYAYGEEWFSLLMVVSIVINYFFGLIVQRFPARAKLAVGVAVTANLGLLAFFKYANFAVANINIVLANYDIAPIVPPQIHLPAGISFFTFHAISYVVDIYRGKNKAQKNPVNIALYIALFSQLMAGPIIRYKDIAGQLIRRRVTLAGFTWGVNRFITGLAKKVLIANTLAVTADKIFMIPADKLSTGVAWVGIMCFILQAYFDFSGYSDMAIGLGRMFGFRFLENFNYPYISRSIRDFWHRWHISLSTWFRDYLYIPLGGSRTSKLRMYCSLYSVFILCGFWHGASWTYVVFGFIQGTAMIIERLGLEKFINTLWRPVGHIYFWILLIFTFILFRSDTITYSVYYSAAVLGFSGHASADANMFTFLDFKTVAAGLTGLIFMLPVMPALKKMIRQKRTLLTGSAAKSLDIGYASVSFVIYATLFVMSVIHSSMDTYNPFIYFRF